VVCQVHRPLARFLSVDKFAAPQSPTFHTANVTSKSKKNDTADNLLLKDRKKKNEKMTANAQNNTFASPYTQADASACKRVVFLPTHPCPPATLDNSLTRIEINKKYYGLKSVI